MTNMLMFSQLNTTKARIVRYCKQCEKHMKFVTAVSYLKYAFITADFLTNNRERKKFVDVETYLGIC